MHIVEELATRLRNRSTIYYSQDDYNAILPDIESQRVSLASDDIYLMWSLFDYASISVLGAVPKPSNKAPVVDEARDKVPDLTSQQFGSERAATGWMNDGSSKPIPSSEIPQLRDSALSGPDDTLFDPEAFSDLPEEWILDDWTLFGAPLSAYDSAFESRTGREDQGII